MALSRAWLPPSPLCSHTHNLETAAEEIHPNMYARSNANLVAKAGGYGAVLVWGGVGRGGAPGEPCRSLVAAAKAPASVGTQHPHGIVAPRVLLSTGTCASRLSAAELQQLFGKALSFQQRENCGKPPYWPNFCWV